MTGEGEWAAVSEHERSYVVWMPWRADQPNEPWIACPSIEAAQIVASVLNGANTHPTADPR